MDTLEPDGSPTATTPSGDQLDVTPNKLADETSPYLLLHANDPVAWYPWGDEAFERARAEDKPVFLSIGYASCHWCHVMHRESFSDVKTAALLNEGFVSVKVDREERPDVDALYMDYVVGSTGHGGWPMSVFVTPERLPIFGGTYFPKEQRGPIPAFRDVLVDVSNAYANDPVGVRQTAVESRAFLTEHASKRHSGPVERGTVERAADVIVQLADPTNGGFGREPKFPQAPLITFLLAYHRAAGDPEAAHQAISALRAMIRGGIYDHAGGGMCRYAVDGAWTVPHFEKMLYDQALLISNLADAYSVRQDPEFAHTAQQTAAFLAREMRAPGGGLIAAISADADGEEGAAYTWTYEEIASVLDPTELSLAEKRLGVTCEGQFEGRVVLTRRDGRGEDAEEVDAVLLKLLASRSDKPIPDVDTKVVVSWNALAARALIEAGVAFRDGDLARTGLDLLRLLKARAVDGDEVVHVLDDPSVADVRLIEDYAHLCAGFLTAAEAGLDRDALPFAEKAHRATVSRFRSDSLLLMTSANTDLPVRPREQQDLPVPSGAATAIANALRLHALTGDETHRSFAAATLSTYWAEVDYAPTHHATVLAAMLAYLESA